MKTVIYFNVTTGESFDQNGTLRTINNPFQAAYGEHRTIEWHLMASTNPEVPVSQWQPWTDWGNIPRLASIAADNNYIAAYRSVLKGDVEGGANAISVFAESVPVAPTGKLRLYRNDATSLEIAYTAVNTISNGFVFSVEIPSGESFSAESRVDILEEPLIHSGEVAVTETDAKQSIFSFDLFLSSWRLAEIMEYEDSDSLITRGLELCVSGLAPENDQKIFLYRCRIPFTISSVITPYLFSGNPVPNQLESFQQWVLALFSGGIEQEFQNKNGEWGSEPENAAAFRWRIPGISSMPWSNPIPIRSYTASQQLNHPFSVTDTGTVEVRILFEELSGVTGPFHCGVFQTASDGSIIEVTSTLDIGFTETEICLRSSTAFVPGEYYLIG